MTNYAIEAWEVEMAKEGQRGPARPARVRLRLVARHEGVLAADGALFALERRVEPLPRDLGIEQWDRDGRPSPLGWKPTSTTSTCSS